MTAERWEKVDRPKLLATNLSARVVNAIGRGYLKGWLTKPLEELTDEDLLSLRNFGPAALCEFRKVVACKDVLPVRDLVWKVPTDKGDFWFTVHANFPQTEALAYVVAVCAQAKLMVAGLIPMKRAQAEPEYSVLLNQRGTGRVYEIIAGKKLWHAMGRVAEFEALHILEKSNDLPVKQRSS